MRIAVTGAMGFIGTRVMSELLSKEGNEVIAVDRWPELLRAYERAQLPILPQVYSNLSLASDVFEPTEFIDVICALRPNAVIHLGAIVDTQDLCSNEMVEQNVRYTRRLIDELSTLECPPVFSFASSASVYGKNHLSPVNPYGLTKAMGERIVERLPTPVSILRFFNVFGEFEHHKGNMASLPFKIARAYQTGDRFDLYSPGSARDFIPVDSVARSIVRQTELMWLEGHDAAGTFDVGTGEATTFEDIDTYIMQATGNTTSACRIVPMPASLETRYQHFTRAGMKPILPCTLNTRDGIEECYGDR